MRLWGVQIYQQDLPLLSYSPNHDLNFYIQIIIYYRRFFILELVNDDNQSVVDLIWFSLLFKSMLISHHLGIALHKKGVLFLLLARPQLSLELIKSSKMKSYLPIIAICLVFVTFVSAQEDILQRFSARKCANKPQCGAGSKFRAFVFDGEGACPETPQRTPGTRQKVCQNVSFDNVSFSYHSVKGVRNE